MRGSSLDPEGRLPTNRIPTPAHPIITRVMGGGGGWGGACRNSRREPKFVVVV